MKKIIFSLTILTLTFSSNFVFASSIKKNTKQTNYAIQSKHSFFYLTPEQKQILSKYLNFNFNFNKFEDYLNKKFKKNEQEESFSFVYEKNELKKEFQNNYENFKIIFYKNTKLKNGIEIQLFVKKLKNSEFEIKHEYEFSNIQKNFFLKELKLSNNDLTKIEKYINLNFINSIENNFVLQLSNLKLIFEKNLNDVNQKINLIALNEKNEDIFKKFLNKKNETYYKKEKTKLKEKFEDENNFNEKEDNLAVNSICKKLDNIISEEYKEKNLSNLKKLNYKQQNFQKNNEPLIKAETIEYDSFANSTAKKSIFKINEDLEKINEKIEQIKILDQKKGQELKKHLLTPLINEGEKYKNLSIVMSKLCIAIELATKNQKTKDENNIILFDLMQKLYEISAILENIIKEQEKEKTDLKNIENENIKKILLKTGKIALLKIQEFLDTQKNLHNTNNVNTFNIMQNSLINLTKNIFINIEKITQ